MMPKWHHMIPTVRANNVFFDDFGLGGLGFEYYLAASQTFTSHTATADKGGLDRNNRHVAMSGCWAGLIGHIPATCVTRVSRLACWLSDRHAISS